MGISWASAEPGRLSCQRLPGVRQKQQGSAWSNDLCKGSDSGGTESSIQAAFIFVFDPWPRKRSKPYHTTIRRLHIRRRSRTMAFVGTSAVPSQPVIEDCRLLCRTRSPRALRAGERPLVQPLRFQLRSRGRGFPNEPPANLEVRSEWMILKEAWHDPSVSQKRVVGALNRPARNAMLHERCAIAVRLLIALDLISRTALVRHHLRIGMHLSKRCAMPVMPSVKP